MSSNDAGITISKLYLTPSRASQQHEKDYEAFGGGGLDCGYAAAANGPYRESDVDDHLIMVVSSDMSVKFVLNYPITACLTDNLTLSMLSSIIYRNSR